MIGINDTVVNPTPPATFLNPPSHPHGLEHLLAPFVILRNKDGFQKNTTPGNIFKPWIALTKVAVASLD